MSTSTHIRSVILLFGTLLTTGCPVETPENLTGAEMVASAGSGGVSAPRPRPMPGPRAGNSGIAPVVSAAAAGGGGLSGAGADVGHAHTGGGHAGAPAQPSAGQGGRSGQAGQSAPGPSLAATFVVPLTTTEEVPRCAAAGENATAIGSASVSPDGQSLSVVLTFTGLSGDATAAHIHFGDRTKMGSVVLDLGPAPKSPIRKTLRAVDYDASAAGVPATFAEFLSALKGGKSYFNLHTMACGPGEIRGQIVDVDPEQDAATGESTRLYSKLSGGEEVPLCAASGAQAVGTGTITIDKDETTIAVRASHAGLSGPLTMAHVHIGAPTERGPVVLDLGNLPPSLLVFHAQDYAPTDPLAPKDFAALIKALKNGEGYFNFHTAACAAGEIRGIIRGEKRKWSDTPSEFQTRLRAADEAPACPGAAPDAIALAGLVISADETQIAVKLRHDALSGELTGAHIHFAEAGHNGPVVLDLGDQLSSPIEKVFKQAEYVAPPEAPADFAKLVAAIRAGKTYFNLHTSACMMGEIRGQITP